MFAPNPKSTDSTLAWWLTGINSIALRKKPLQELRVKD